MARSQVSRICCRLLRTEALRSRAGPLLAHMTSDQDPVRVETVALNFDDIIRPQAKGFRDDLAKCLDVKQY